MKDTEAPGKGHGLEKTNETPQFDAGGVLDRIDHAVTAKRTKIRSQ